MEQSIDVLPESLILECLSRLHYKDVPAASLVCHKWLDLLESRQFYSLRKQLGHINHFACLLQSHPPSPPSSYESNPLPLYVINVFDPVSRECKILPPLPNPAIQFDHDSEIVSSEGKLILMNKCHDPVNRELGNSLFVFEFSTGRWWQGKNLPTRKLHFAMAATDDCRVFIAGGHQSEDVDSDSAWMYDVRKDEWSELPRIIHVPGLSKGKVIGNQFIVKTLSMIDLTQSVETYDFELGEWKQVNVKQLWTKRYEYFARIEDGCMLICSRIDKRCRLKFYKLPLGDRSLLIYYKKGNGQLFSISIQEEGKRVKIEVPHQIYGDVYSMCCVEMH
ncbi:F-box/kelch-repeat protein At1g80440-like [Impatiens glandulifera]|uniref:F-box/kelch-repeat protein At1g80440-like n=1 Tax=Impatiens glandulifera TaxID=253017 RepID=UPI001FB0A637|nr:F-box/kelch-repeat protein At1g80440-like [Impatiens glandulifera]